MERREIQANYFIKKLNVGDSISNFDCGDEDLNDFIINESGFYRKALLAVSYILRERNTKKSIGYFSLANDKVSVSDFSNITEFNRFRRKRFVNDKRIKSYPAAKICRLGIDLSMKGQAIGTFLIDFIKSYFLINNKTGCRFLTVDAYIEAIPFYLKNGFVLLNQDENDTATRLMFFDLQTISQH